MNKKAKRRLIIITLLIVVIVVVVLAVVGAGGAAKSLTVAQLDQDDYTGKRVQVSGTVVDDSYTTDAKGMTFDVSDPEDKTKTLHVSYEGSVPSTFGNGVTAISTGTMQDDGTLLASEMITKCPSKYESAEGSLTVANLYACGNSMIGQETKLAGYIKAGSLQPAGVDQRFILYSQDAEIVVKYDGALPDTVTDDSSVVLTGALGSDETFTATEVAEEEVDK